MPRKRLFVLCDGTGNSPESHQQTINGVKVVLNAGATNVERLRNILVPEIHNLNQRARQGWEIHSFYEPVAEANTLVYYDRGLGAPSSAGRPHRISSLHSQLNACGITENIIEAYDFLATNYEPDNTDIYLFGFSRGSYTIRLLANMIAHIGLIRTEDLVEKPLAHGEVRKFKLFDTQEDEYTTRLRLGFSLYNQQKNTEPGNSVAKFVEKYSRYVDVKFMGLWDTVRGKISRKERILRSSTLPENVLIARHAVSIDERRKIFKPQIWITLPNQDSKQLWFAGAHADVGGGYPETGLSDVSLKWMIDEINQAADLNIPTSDLNPQPLAPQFDSLQSPILEGLPLKWADATKKYYRPLLQTDRTESLHPSVFERYGTYTAVQTKVGNTVVKTGLYCPANLQHVFLLYRNLSNSRQQFEQLKNAEAQVVHLEYPNQDQQAQQTAGELAVLQLDAAVQNASYADCWSDVEEDPNLSEDRNKQEKIRSMNFVYGTSGFFVQNRAAEVPKQCHPPASIGKPQVS